MKTISTMNNRIFEEVQNGNFSNFNKLNENQKIEIMKKWDRSMWIKFRMQNTVSEREVFDPIFDFIDSDVEGKQ